MCPYTFHMNNYKYCPVCRRELIKRPIEGRNRSTCESCGWIYYKNPLPAAACLASNDKREILLIKRGIEPCKGSWGLPGGFIELNETLREAAEREFTEETGLSGKATDLIDVVVNPSELYGAVLVVGFHVDITGGALEAGDDAEDVAFFPFGKLPELPFASHRMLVEKFLERAE